MKIIYSLLMVAIVCICVTGCELKGVEQTYVSGSGPIVTDTLDLNTFDKIENSGIANFHISIGSEQSVLFKAQQNIMDVMSNRVVGETFEVRLLPNVTIQDYEEIRFEIAIPSISEINLLGIGNFFLSGDSQEKLTINLYGVGHIDSYDMPLDTCIINILGVGDCKVRVDRKLDVTILGSGDVYYLGEPTIYQRIEGSGSLKNEN